MERDAFIMMILFLGLTWGGFAYALRLALKREAQKRDLENGD